MSSKRKKSKKKNSDGGGAAKKDAGDADKEGYLDKRGSSGLRNWNKRYFLLKASGKLLCYWKNEKDFKDGKGRKTITLKATTTLNKDKNELTIDTPGAGGASVRLRADTAHEMSGWKQKLKQAVKRLKAKVAKNMAVTASAEEVKYMEDAMTVTLPGNDPQKLWVRVDKTDLKMTFSESKERMHSGKASAAAALNLSNFLFSKHGKCEFRLLTSTTPRRVYIFEVANKSTLTTWQSSLLRLGVKYSSKSAAASADASVAQSSSDRGGESSSSASSYPQWIQDRDKLVANGVDGPADAVLVAFNQAQEFFAVESEDPDEPMEEELPVLTVIECAEQMIEDLSYRYNDCRPDRVVDVFGEYLQQYNSRLITELNKIGIDDPECLAEYTPEELKNLIQLIITYFSIVNPAISGTKLSEKVSVAKFESDKLILVDVYTSKALAIITDMLRRSCGKLLTMKPEIYAQIQSNVVKTVTVNDIFRVILGQLEISEECEVEEVNENMLFSCVKAVQRYILVLTSYLPIIPFDLKFLCAISNDFEALKDELIKLLNDKLASGDYRLHKRLKTLNISPSDKRWPQLMFAQSRDLEDIFKDIEYAQKVAMHSLLDNFFKGLDFSGFFQRFDRSTPYDNVFEPLKNVLFPECARYFGQSDSMKLLFKLCASHCQVNYYHALFAKIRANDQIKGKFWLKKFVLNAERIGQSSQEGNYFRYFRDINAGRLIGEFRREDRDERGTVSRQTFMAVVEPYLPDKIVEEFKQWIADHFCQLSQRDKDANDDKTSWPISYQAWVLRVQDHQKEHEQLKGGNLGPGRKRSLVYDSHKFEDFFRGRVVQYLPDDKRFFFKDVVNNTNVFKDICHILTAQCVRERNAVSLPTVPMSLFSIFEKHAHCLQEIMDAVTLCFNVVTEVRMAPSAAPSAGGAGKRAQQDVVPLTKDMRSHVLGRSRNHMSTVQKKHAKHQTNTHDTRWRKMTDSWWQIMHPADASSKRHLLSGRADFAAKQGKKHAFNFSFVERHDFPEALVADERIEVSQPKVGGGADGVVTENLDDWGI